MTGDAPCNLPCDSRWCRYNEYGRRCDNDTCENQTPKDKEEHNGHCDE